MIRVEESPRYKNSPLWKGSIVDKHAADLVLYATEIFNSKPDWIIETGTCFGGSAIFLADMMRILNGKGKVISIDIKAMKQPKHEYVIYIDGSCLDPATVAKVKGMISGKVMATFDCDHRGRHVLQEMKTYGPLVTPGMCMVVEDMYRLRGKEVTRHWPYTIVKAFLAESKEFIDDPMWERYGVAQVRSTREGWLRKNV